LQLPPNRIETAAAVCCSYTQCSTIIDRRRRAFNSSSRAPLPPPVSAAPGSRSGMTSQIVDCIAMAQPSGPGTGSLTYS
jgi:hypothetical protein